ncbi:hypothetical protein BKA65DRAFT_495767, partial [Rhexocercosporidium sp. MPI-PUGE-AT-0058]
MQLGTVKVCYHVPIDRATPQPTNRVVWATKIITLISMALFASSNVFIKGRIKLGRISSARPDLRILGYLTLALVVLGVFLLEFALFVPLPCINSYCISKGFNPSFYSLGLPILNVGPVFGRLLSGYLADRYGRLMHRSSSIIASGRPASVPTSDRL